LKIAAVRVEGATHTRQSFLGSIIKPHLPGPYNHDESTLQSVLLKARNIGHTLQMTDLFHTVHAVVEPSRDHLAAPEDVDIIFKTKEKGRFLFKTSTEFGNSEGSAVSETLKVPEVLVLISGRLYWAGFATFSVVRKSWRVRSRWALRRADRFTRHCPLRSHHPCLHMGRYLCSDMNGTTLVTLVAQRLCAVSKQSSG
jgi:hypothetical protein